MEYSSSNYIIWKCGFLAGGWIFPLYFCFIFLLNTKEIPSSIQMHKNDHERHPSHLAPKSLGPLSNLRMAILISHDCSVPVVTTFSEPKFGVELNKY